MDIQLEKNQAIEMFRQVNDIELIRAIKTMLDFGIKKEKELENYNIPEHHKTIVRERIANSKPENILQWNEVKDSLRFK